MYLQRITAVLVQARFINDFRGISHAHNVEYVPSHCRRTVRPTPILRRPVRRSVH